MPKTERIWELDALRGFCILCMVIVHLLFDLRYFLALPIQPGGIVQIAADYGGVIFVLISGVCVTLGHRSVRRGLIVFGCGMLITLVTWSMAKLGMAAEDIVIRFGVLHLLGVCMMVYPLFRRLPNGLLAILGVAMAAVGYVLTARRFNVAWLFPLGIMSPTFSSSDYFPLLPHLGWFLCGVVIGRTIYRSKRSLLPNAPVQAAPLRFLQLCGRKSLWIYLIHQPVLYGMVEAARLLLS